jgi:hypothetical protein
MSEITVDWPSGAAMTPDQWKRRLEDLATQAERMVGKQCSLQDQAQLALTWLGLCWHGFSAETIAASCRASLLLGQSVVMAAAPADQLVEIAERLDAIWEAAQADPAAGVVTVAPLVELPPAEPRRRRGKQSDLTPVDDLEFDAPELEPDHAPGPYEPEPAPPAPAPEQHREPRPLRPRAERMAPRPAPPAPEPVEIPAGVAPAGNPSRPPEPVELQVAPEALELSRPWPERCNTSTPPPNWLLAAEVSELLDISEVTIGRWRAAGRFGAEGVGWVKCGRSFYYAPEAVEELESSEVPAGLDDLLSEVRAA